MLNEGVLREWKIPEAGGVGAPSTTDRFLAFHPFETLVLLAPPAPTTTSRDGINGWYWTESHPAKMPKPMGDDEREWDEGVERRIHLANRVCRPGEVAVASTGFPLEREKGEIALWRCCRKAFLPYSVRFPLSSVML